MKHGTITTNTGAGAETAEVLVHGGFGYFVDGTWNGVTFTLYYYSAFGTWKPIVTETPSTDNSTGQKRCWYPEMASPLRIKGVVSGGAAPSLNWEFFGNVVAT